MLDSKSFQLLKNTLEESRGYALHYYESDREPLETIDMGIRTELYASQQLYEELRRIIRLLRFGEIFLVYDTLHLFTVLFRASPGGSAFYSIGPFLNFPLEDKDYSEIKTENHLSSTDIEALRSILQRVPCNISRMEALTVARNILRFANNLESPPVQNHIMKPTAAYAGALVPVPGLESRAAKIEERYRHESALLDCVRSGDETNALREAQFFILSNLAQRMPNYLQSHRALMYSTNTEFRKQAQLCGIHPLFLDEISLRFAKKFMVCTNHQQLNDVYLEMIHDYCALCRNNATASYSPRVQKIIHYIQLHLGEDLSLGVIAQAMNFSPGYIAQNFKKEVGNTLIGYITSQRITKAKALLKSSDMTIREISAYVGIPDWNYFTKLFKKETGTTPQQYRKETL